MDRDLSSIWGILVFGKAGSLWEEAEINELKLSHMLADIPIEVRRYSFLQKLTDKNYYKNDFVRLYQENYEIEKEILSGRYTSAGQPKDQVAKIRIYDAINFVYGNKITFDKFSEHKNFTKVALKQRFKGMLNQNELAAKYSLDGRDDKSYIGFQEILLMVRTFSFDDLSVFYEKEDGHNLILQSDSIDKFEEYLQNIMSYFEEKFTGEMKGEVILEYLTLKGEVKNALFLASYYAEHDEICGHCADYLLTFLPHDELDIWKRKSILERLKDKLSNKDIIRNLLEIIIKEDIEQFNNGDDNIVNLWKNETGVKTDMLRSWFPGYKSNSLKEVITRSRKKVADEIGPILKGII